MPDDRISSYRVVRVAIHLPHDAQGEAHWTVTPLEVRNGVPHGTVSHRGALPNLGSSPSHEQVAYALHKIAEQMSGP